MLVVPLEAVVNVASLSVGWGSVLLQWLDYALGCVLFIHHPVLRILGILLDDGLDFLVHGDDDDEGGSGESPDTADRCPDVEACQVEDVDGEHGAGPDTDEKQSEEHGRAVGGDLGCAEFADDYF